MTVQQLRDNGFKVSVAHYRLVDSPDTNVHFPRTVAYNATLMHESVVKKDKLVAWPGGGITFVMVTSPDGVNSTAYATCIPKDNFNKKLAVKIALGRALKKLRDGGDTF